MKKNLTNSLIDRQNIMNNKFALDEIDKAVGIKGVLFEGSYRFTKQQIADFYEVDSRTIDNYINKFGKELRQNGYEILRGKRLKGLKLAMLDHFANETDFITKTTVLGIFDFRAFLNLGMLLTESEIKEVT